MKNISIRQAPNENKMYEDTILEINEYNIQKDTIPITFFISKTKNYVIIRSISYELKLTQNDFSLLFKQIFRTIDEIYLLLKKIFEQKCILIQEITNKTMKLVIILNVGQGAQKKVELNLQSQKEINSIIMNDLFTKYLKLEENNYILNEKNKKLTEENIKIKNDITNLQTQNKANENHINLLLSKIDKIIEFIDNVSTNQNNEEKNEGKQDNIVKTTSLTKSYSVNQNLNLKSKNIISQSFNPSYSTNSNRTDNNESSRANYQQSLDIYGEEQLFRTEEGRVIFRNGLLNGIIKKYSEINNVVNKIQEKLRKGAKFNIAFKATELGDKTSVFHQKCDNLEMSLVIIETQKGVRF